MKIENVVSQTEFLALSKMNYEQFCGIANKVVQLCVEEALKALPHVITSLAQQAAYLKKLSDDFYDSNKDLANHKDVVAKVIENIEANNPGMEYEKVLSIAAPRARQTLSLRDKVN